MSSRPTTPATSTAPAVPHVEAAEIRDQQVLDQRSRVRVRHVRALTDLMGQRDDLRGVHALADLVDDGVRWNA